MNEIEKSRTAEIKDLHGKFIESFKKTLKLHKEQDRLKNATVSHLTEGYRLLSESKPLEGWKKTLHCYASCVNTIREELDCSWETAFNELVDETGFPFNVLLNWHCLFFGIVSDELIPEPITKEEHEQTAKAIQQICEKHMRKVQESKTDEKIIYCS